MAEKDHMTETNIIPASTPPLLTAEERAQAEALADRALNGDLEALNTFEAEIPQARHYLIEVFGNLARDTRRQIIESYLSPEDAVRKRGINPRRRRGTLNAEQRHRRPWSDC